MITITKNEIVHLFLNIFRTQQNATNAPAKYVRLSSPDEQGNITYELQVFRHGQKIARRITIGPLGEDSGSKSKCYKVIFDEILVVKIPPTPVMDFHNYIQSIDSEKNITDILSPHIQCVIPSVSAILKKIKPFSDESKINPSILEDRCIEKLKSFAYFQNYLKIRNCYAFFMNLSTYSFLGQVIKDMHLIKDRMYKEVLSQVDMLEHPALFEEIYGVEALLFYNISEIYIKYDDKLSRLLSKYKLSSIPAYDKKEWFLTHLAGKSVEEKQGDIPEFINELNTLLRKTIARNNEIVQKYRRIITRHIYQTKFNQIKPGIEGLITNLIKLLATLRHRGIAIRDLKPDNVFVVGDLSLNPHLLSHPDDYSIGLIDFETSVNLKPGPGERIAQPMLAGTPSYATPSHLFKNELLAKIYGDTARILHLQDWQAINSMIFNVITGGRLANETGRLIPTIVKTIKKKPRQSMDKPDVYKEYNKAFWHKANREFQEKISGFRPIIKNAKIIIPENAKSMFNEEAQILQSGINEKIEQLVQTQKLFASKKAKDELIKAPYQKIKIYKSNWEQGKNTPKIHSSIKKQIIYFFNKLISIKYESIQIENFLRLLEQEKPVISAYNLMSFMFSIVMGSMYKQPWELRNGNKRKKPGIDKYSQVNISQDDNSAIESTIT